MVTPMLNKRETAVKWVYLHLTHLTANAEAGWGQRGLFCLQDTEAKGWVCLTLESRCENLPIIIS